MVVVPESEAILGEVMDLRDHFPLEFGGAPRTKRAVLPDMLEAVKATAREEVLEDAPPLEEADVGPARPSDPEELGEGPEDDDANPYMLPLTNELKLQGATGAVCVAMQEFSQGLTAWFRPLMWSTAGGAWWLADTTTRCVCCD